MCSVLMDAFKPSIKWRFPTEFCVVMPWIVASLRKGFLDVELKRPNDASCYCSCDIAAKYRC